MEEMEFALEAVEVTAQAIVFLLLSLTFRATVRAATTRQLTFFKVYSQNFGALFYGWILDFARADQSLRVRAPYILVLASYTTAIAVLFGTSHARMESVSDEMMFPALFLGGTFMQLLLADDETRSLRHFLFAPLAVGLLWLIIAGTELHLGLARFQDVFEYTYLGLTSVPVFFALAFSVVIAFTFIAGSHVRRSGWQKLLEDVSGVALLAPVLAIFLNEGTGGVGWSPTILWSVKAGVILGTFDIFRMFFPQFGMRQPETALVRFAFPLSSILFFVMWATRVTP